MRASDGRPLVAKSFSRRRRFPGPLNGCFDPPGGDALNLAAVKTHYDLAGIAALVPWTIHAITIYQQVLAGAQEAALLSVADVRAGHTLLL